MSKHFEYSDDHDEYNWRALVYPNWTWQKDLKQDSFYIIMSNVLKHLTKHRKDTHFTVLTPKIMPNFTMPNVDQILYDVPMHPNEMRHHFNTRDIRNVTNHRHYDWDFVYSYLPEHTLQLKNHFYNITNTRPVFLGYSAYLEIPKTTPYEANVLRNHYAGLMEMNSCGVNSQATKDTVMKYAPTCLPDKDVKKLENILEPLPRGWDNVRGKRHRPDENDKIIVWNHRPDGYKGYPWFLKQMDELREHRQDFKVWVPLSNSPDRDYIYTDGFDRKKYFTELSKCWVGVCGESQHTGWANSASDGMAVGVPYIFYDADYYEQYAKGAGIYYKTNEDFQKHMNNILDQSPLRFAYSHKSKNLAKKNSWSNVIRQYDGHFMNAQKQMKVVSKTETYDRIVAFIHEYKYVTKYDIISYLKWGKGIPFTPYRNRLRKEKKIKLTKIGYMSENA